jgi:hypothetical protein
LPTLIVRLARAFPDAPEPPTLRDVQHALARERGHESWVALTQAIADSSKSDIPLTALLDAAGKGDATRVAAILEPFVQGIRVVRIEGGAVVAAAGRHSASVGDHAAEAERHPCLDGACRR